MCMQIKKIIIVRYDSWDSETFALLNYVRKIKLNCLDTKIKLGFGETFFKFTPISKCLYVHMLVHWTQLNGITDNVINWVIGSNLY